MGTVIVHPWTIFVCMGLPLPMALHLMTARKALVPDPHRSTCLQVCTCLQAAPRLLG